MSSAPQRGFDARRLLIALLVAIALPGFILLGGVAFGVRGDNMTILLLALATAMVGVLPMVVDQSRPPRQRHVTFSILTLWYVATFVVPVFANYLHADYYAIPGNVSQLWVTRPEIIVGQTVVLIGFVTLTLTYFSPLARLAGRSLPAPTHDWPPQVLMGVALAMIAMGMTIFLGRLTGLIPIELGTGILGTLAATLVYANVLLVIAYRRDGQRLALPIIGFVLVIAVVRGFLSGSKMSTLIAPALVGLTVMVLGGRIRFRWVLLGFLALVLLYPTNLFYRTVVLKGSGGLVGVLMNLGRSSQQLSDFVTSGSLGDHVGVGLQATGARMDGLGVASAIIRDTPSRVPFQEGRTLWLFFIAFVPRLIWPDKPTITLGRWISEVYAESPEVGTFFGPTAIGDFYLNFGVPGVIGGMFVLGLVLRIAHETLIARTTTCVGVVAAIVILFQLALRYMGSVALTWSTAVFALIPILATHLALRTLGLTVPAHLSWPGREEPKP